MNKFEDLMSQADDNMTQSMGGDGVREAVAHAHHLPELPTDGPAAGRSRDMMAGILEIDRILPDPNNPRGNPESYADEALDQLAASIAKEGVLQPVLVRWDPDSAAYRLVAGHRRFFSARRAGLAELPCRFAEGLDALEVLKYQLIENDLRDDLSPIARANAYQQLMQRNGLTVSSLAEELHQSPSEVSKSLKLLTLPDGIRADVDAGTIPPATAYQLARIDDPSLQQQLAQQAREGASRDAIATAVQDAQGRRNHATSRTSHRLTCRIGGAVITVSDGDPIRWETYMDILDGLRGMARKAQNKQITVEAFPAYVKEKTRPPQTSASDRFSGRCRLGS